MPWGGLYEGLGGITIGGSSVGGISSICGTGSYVAGGGIRTGVPGLNTGSGALYVTGGGCSSGAPYDVPGGGAIPMNGPAGAKLGCFVVVVVGLVYVIGGFIGFLLLEGYCSLGPFGASYLYPGFD